MAENGGTIKAVGLSTTGEIISLYGVRGGGTIDASSDNHIGGAKTQS